VIARLRKENDDGLRRRNVSTKDTVATKLAPQALQHTGNTGVPVPTVALISLFIFLLTYLLFWDFVRILDPISDISKLYMTVIKDSTSLVTILHDGTDEEPTNANLVAIDIGGF
jgi:hypothetical protein